MFDITSQIGSIITYKGTPPTYQEYLAIRVDDMSYINHISLSSLKEQLGYYD